MSRDLFRSPLSRPLLALAALAGLLAVPGSLPAATCTATVTADVVALDQVYFWNRYGAVEPQGMIYALERDVVHVDQKEGATRCIEPQLALAPGKVRLREGKRPRPLVLRVNEGECLQVNFTNLLAPQKVDEEQPATRDASVHVVGLPYVDSITDGGMWVGDGPSGLVAPGGSTTYTFYAEAEGTYLLYSGAAMVGGQGDGGSISPGLFGAVHVQPAGARYFRSQVLRKDLELASIGPLPEDDFPQLDYTETYQSPNDPHQCWRTGTPILEMTQPASGNRTLIHSDLSAIVTGANLFSFANFDYPLDDPTYAEGRRNEPYREFTVIFHDELGAVQAFPHFEDEVLAHTLHSLRDAFAINYGTGGIGAEVLANRLGVGPVHECIDCKYEEFFLDSWAVGDPAMIVDEPANAPCGDSKADWQDLRDGVHTACTPTPGPKATKALYPDDPSNVYHSYMNDHVKFRNLHAGIDDHHIFHLHAHQWLHTPKSDRSSYLDSQAIGQGSAFTYEIAYEGSGNRPKTVGDSIFHCHFYPHFAQGMWALWRVHDVLEIGTELIEGGPDDGKPVHTVGVGGKIVTSGTRALPDGEIRTGTPIPAVVPLPGKSLPPPPTPIQIVDGQIDQDYTTHQAKLAYDAWKNGGRPHFNPGYPFFIPGQAGMRAPHPPLDFAVDANGEPRDGGLPRHVTVAHPNQLADEAHDRLDFHKHTLRQDAIWLPEEGTELEQIAMDFHALRFFDNPAAGGPPPGYDYELNGAPPQPGAPYADPCIKDQWLPGNPPHEPVDFTRTIQAVDLEMDVVLNKAGWHFPQQRIISLLADVEDTLEGKRPPEPLFFRANSNDCVHYELTNLVPYEYQVDDFQVRTPTDILGQHIHLVKFDVTSSDGSANGFNYEDGTFSPEEVQERIEAIRALNGCAEGFVRTVHPTTGKLDCPEAEYDPRFSFLPPQDKNCNGFDDFLGAQTTVQRWWADPVLDSQNNDRTLRTVFTHDHFGPSTHQQAGLYAGLVVEPEGSVWYHNESSLQLGTRPDGGPTSWQARIEPPGAPAHREFLVEFSDFQLAYERNTVWQACPDPTFGWADPPRAINPPGRKSVGPPFLYQKPNPCPTNDGDPDGTISTANTSPVPPCPEGVSADDPGFISVNYRSEPLAFRISDTFDPGVTPKQVSGIAGDLSYAYASWLTRDNPEMNKKPDQSLTWVPYPALTGGLEEGDPFTPLMRAYEGDPVQIRVLVGAHEEEHNFAVHGNKWLFEPFDADSGYRNSQMMGISEWFDFLLPPAPKVLEPEEAVDFLYRPSSAAEWQWGGAWGLLRMYQGVRADLPTLTSNPDGKAVSDAERVSAFRGAPGDELKPTPENQLVGTEPNRPVACPPTGKAPRPYDITAVSAREVLPDVGGGLGRTLVYNRRADSVAFWDDDLGYYAGTRSGPLHDPTAILFVYTQDLDYSGGRPKLKPDAPVEPLILRAQAGECVKVTLRNDLDPTGGSNGHGYDLDGWSGWHMLFERFNANQVAPSLEVGLHPQLVYYDPTQAGGDNVGVNLKYHGSQTVAPGEKITYYWYAGEVTESQLTGGLIYSPIEFGATGLASSDPLEHSQKGAVGALVVEPAGATWSFTDSHSYLNDPESSVERPRKTRAEATVTPSNGKPFRELVTVIQNDLNMRYADRDEKTGETYPIENLSVGEDPTESGQKAFNYRAEPLWFRMGHSPGTPETETREMDFGDVFTDGEIGGRRPVTHIFDAEPGDATRFRVVLPAGHTQNHVFEVQGHQWWELPYYASSTAIGARQESERQGARMGVGASSHYDQVLTSGAGGPFEIEGEYLYKDYVQWGLDHGLWGIFFVHVGLP